MTVIVAAIRDAAFSPDLSRPDGLASPRPQRRGARRPLQATPHLLAAAELSARLPRRHGDAVEILLAAARPFDDGFEPLLPFWTQEAMHRAVATLRLFTAVQHRDRGRRLSRSIYERRLALHLAATFASLETKDTTRILPCSGALRETARDLVALFGPASGQIILQTEVTPVSLPAYKRRALVLLGSELVVNSLTHAFEGRSVGHLELRLDRVRPARMRLRISDDGIGSANGHPDPGISIAGGLADLLEGEISYVTGQGQGTAVEVVFPTA